MLQYFNLIKLNSIIYNKFALFSIYLVFTVALVLLFNYNFIFIFLSILSFLFTFFLLDKFKLSDNFFIKELQLFYSSLALLILTLFLLYLISIKFNLIETIYCSANDEKLSAITTNVNPGNKGWFNTTITHVVGDNVVETVNHATNQISQAIENVGDKVATALATGSVAGATAYAVKNSSLPAVAKAGLIVTTAATGAIIQNSEKLLKINTSVSNSEKFHPNSPTDNGLNEFSASSPLENFDFHSFFGLDPNNILLCYIFNMLAFSFIILFLLYILCLYLFYIYFYKNNNLEFKWIDKIFPINYSKNLKSFFVNLLKKWDKSNHIIVTFTLILLLINTISLTYFLYQFYFGLDDFILEYLKYNKL